jgi:hypothetical protein
MGLPARPERIRDMKTIALVSAFSLAAFIGGAEFATYNPQIMAESAPSAKSLKCEVKDPEGKAAFTYSFVVSFAGNTWEAALPGEASQGPQPLKITPAAYVLTKQTDKGSFVIDRVTGQLSFAGLVAGSCSPITSPKF